MRLFDEFVNPIGNEIDLTGLDGSGTEIDAQGRIVVLGQDAGQLKFQRYDSTGAPLGGMVQVGNPAPQGSLNASIAVAGNGTFVVAWSDDNTGNYDADYGEVMVARYDASGTKIGTTLTLSTGAGWDGNPCATLGDHGVFQVSWKSRSQVGNVWDLHTSRLALDGSVQQPESDVNRIRTVGIYSSCVGEPNGRSFLVWDAQAPLSTMVGQRIDANGSMVGLDPW
jgi:hypothetical protein